MQKRKINLFWKYFKQLCGIETDYRLAQVLEIDFPAAYRLGILSVNLDHLCAAYKFFRKIDGTDQEWCKIMDQVCAELEQIKGGAKEV